MFRRMKLTHRGFESVCFCLIAIFLACQPALAQTNDSNSAAVEQVKSFYSFHFAHNMAFTRDAVKGRAAWITPWPEISVAGPIIPRFAVL